MNSTVQFRTGARVLVKDAPATVAGAAPRNRGWHVRFDGESPTAEPSLVPLLDVRPAPPLPPGWVEAYDDKSWYYYYQSPSGETQWERPSGRSVAAVARAREQARFAEGGLTAVSSEARAADGGGGHAAMRAEARAPDGGGGLAAMRSAARATDSGGRRSLSVFQNRDQDALVARRQQPRSSVRQPQARRQPQFDPATASAAVGNFGTRRQPQRDMSGLGNFGRRTRGNAVPRGGGGGGGAYPSDDELVRMMRAGGFGGCGCADPNC